MGNGELKTQCFRQTGVQESILEREIQKLSAHKVVIRVRFCKKIYLFIFILQRSRELGRGWKLRACQQFKVKKRMKRQRKFLEVSVETRRESFHRRPGKKEF